MSLLHVVEKDRNCNDEPGSAPLNFSEFKKDGFVTFGNDPFSETNPFSGETEMLPKSMIAKMNRTSSSLEWLEDL